MAEEGTMLSMQRKIGRGPRWLENYGVGTVCGAKFSATQNSEFVRFAY
jgi:hypothetical protein